MRSRRNGWRSIAIGGIVAAVVTASVPATAFGEGDAGTIGRKKEATASAILDWSAIAETAVAEGRGPGPAQILMTIVQVAIYDTVVALEGGSEPYAVTPEVRGPASLAAAVATAAHGVLVARVPDQAAAVDEQYRASLASIPDTKAKRSGIDVGTQVADAIVALRASDGLGAVIPFVQPTPGPGVFEPVAPTPPTGTDLGQVTPFAMSSPDQFRPDGPDPLDSPEYAEDFIEVAELGRLDSEQRTEEQTEIARFWSDNGFLQWSRALRAIATERALNVREAARMLTMVHVAAADVTIGCFEAKYHYLFWRPEHAIQRADTDGNDATEPDPTWASLIVANFPEYPAGAACFNGAITSTLASYFGTDEVPFDVESAVTGTTHHFERLSDALAENLDARVWSGLHFRNSVEEGAELGRDVAELVRSTLFHAT